MANTDPRVDWEAIERSPQFRELIAARRRFVLPATIFFLAWYIGFILLAGYAPDFMARSVYEGLTVGYCLALTQFVMVAALGLMYLRRSEKVFDPLADEVVRGAGAPTARATRRARRAGLPRRSLGGDDAMIPIAADTNVEALVIFAIVLSITLVITYWASKRMTGADQFWAAGRSISGIQNGLAISGDYLSAASFLGIAGLIFIFGFDGFLYSVGFLVAFLTVMFLLAERMRNAGKYTIADVLAFRLRERPARTAAAIGTLTVAAFYLIAQMVGAGVLVQALVGIDFSVAVLITGVMMLCYVIFGGMLATTWVQIIKAILLMTAIVVMSLFVLERVGFNPIELFNRAERNTTAESTFSLGPGTFLSSPIDTVSLGIALVLGTAGLPHILMRFFTVPDSKAARSSVVWAIFIIGAFYILTTFVGFGARALLGEGGVAAAGTGGNLAAPNLAQFLGGGEGTFGGDLFLAIVAAVAFATILAVVAGLVLSASGAMAHDLWSNVIRKGRDSEHEEVLVARIAAAAIGAIAIAIAIIGGAGLNVSFMVGLAFAVAASANFPALLLALTWRRFNTAGALTGVLFGVVQRDRARDHLAEGLAGPRRRGRRAVVLHARQPGDHLDPARVHRLLAGHRPVDRARQRAQLLRAARALGNRARRGEGGVRVDG